MTAIDVESHAVEAYRAATPVPFVAGIVLSAAEAKAQVEAIRELQRSVMTEGTDYGIVPGTERPALFKSGAELLLKVHGYGHRCEPVEVERDEHGRKFGVTYRTTVTIGDRDHETVIATCDGYCGMDESKYYQSTTALEARERANASKYQRPARPEKWAEEYRAPWNTLVKMAIKRSLVGAALQATAASGLFTQDLEDAQPEAPPPPPVYQTLGYADPDELRSVNDSLLEMMRAVPDARKEQVGAAFDQLGYPKGKRFPVAKDHVAQVRAILSGADADTGEMPPEDDERPFEPQEATTAATGGPGAPEPAPDAPTPTSGSAVPQAVVDATIEAVRVMTPAAVRKALKSRGQPADSNDEDALRRQLGLLMLAEWQAELGHGDPPTSA